MPTIELRTNEAALRADGYQRYERRELVARVGGEDRAERLLAEIRAAFGDLPPDPYARGTRRYRRYARAVVVPWAQTLTWLPFVVDQEHGWCTEYYQGEHNPDYPGVRRRFPAIPLALLENELLREIVLFDLDQTRWAECIAKNPVHVGVHLVKLSVDDDEPEAMSSPNMLHQDGEPFTFAHLVMRQNVTGGVNVIAPPRCAGLLPHELSADLVRDTTFTLEQPLDSYGVHDPVVSHYVSPVRLGERRARGERGVILVDFTPFVPRI